MEHNAITLIESFFLVKICIPGQAFPGCTAGRLTPGSLQLNQIVCLDAAFSHNSPSIPLLKITSVCKDARKNTVTNSGLRKNLHYFKESFEWMSDDATEDRGSETITHITHSNSIQINVRTRRLLCDLELAERTWAWPWILTSKYLQAPYDVDFNVRKLMCYFLIIREQFSWEVVSLVLMQKTAVQPREQCQTDPFKWTFCLRWVHFLPQTTERFSPRLFLMRRSPWSPLSVRGETHLLIAVTICVLVHKMCK